MDDAPPAVVRALEDEAYRLHPGTVSWLVDGVGGRWLLVTADWTQDDFAKLIDAVDGRSR